MVTVTGYERQVDTLYFSCFSLLMLLVIKALQFATQVINLIGSGILYLLFIVCYIIVKIYCL